MKLHPRKLARQMARNTLTRAGATGYNKTGMFRARWKGIARDIAEKGVKR